MRATVVIDLLQCNYCGNLVVAELNKYNGVSEIGIDISTKTLSFDFKSHNTMEGIRIRLAEIGYPITKDPSVIKRPTTYVNEYLEERKGILI